MKYKFLIMLLVCVLLVGTVSAISKTYNSETQTVTLKETFLFIPINDMAEVQLLTPLETIRETGYQRIAEYEVKGKTNIEKLFFGETKTYNKKEYDKGNKIEINRKIELKYKYIEEYVVEDREYNGMVLGEYIVTGSHIETREVWLPFDKNTKIKKGESIVIGVYTNLVQGDHLEWIPSFLNKEIKEWASVIVTSGSETTDGLYTVVTFTSNGYFNFTGDSLNLSVLVVAGGGSGGGNQGGAGGGGGLIYKNEHDLSAGNYDIIIGAGGDAVGGGVTGGNTGGDSSFDTLIADGGGAGGSNTANAGDGGAGGGGGGGDGSLGGTGTVGQGNDGGDGPTGVGGSGSDLAGGGGAGSLSSVGSSGGNGGNGGSYDISGSSVYYAGGGGGAAQSGSTAGTGGAGGGGNGGVQPSTSPTSGAANTGGGGGGAWYSEGNTGAGGSGIIIIKYLTPIINPTITLNSPVNTTNSTDPSITFNGTISGVTPVNVSLIIDGVYNQTNTSTALSHYYFTEIFDDGSYIWNYESCNNEGCTITENRVINIDTINPTIASTSPVGTYDFLEFGSNVWLNTTITDTTLDTCFYDYNNTNQTFPCSTGVESTIQLSQELGNFDVTVWANDTFGNMDSSILTWDFRVFQNNITYEPFVTETSNQQFDISINHTSSIWNSITANLEYDSVNYSATQSGSGDILSFSRSIEVPAIATETENKSFYWYFSLANSTSTYISKSSAYQQNITEIAVSLCGAGDTPFVRFFTKDAENPFPIVNATFKSAWNLGTVGGSGLLANHSYEDLTEANNTWEFCISPNSSNYSLTVDVEVDATDFAKNFYFIQNDTYFSGETINITLYMLNDSLATPTVLRTRNTAQNRLSNVLIYIDVFDVGTNDYYTVGMAKTNENGEDVVYLNWYDTLYRFRLWQAGVETLRTNNTKIFVTPKIFEIGEDFTYSFDKFANIVHTLTYSNTTKTFTLVFETNDATIEEGCLRVIKREAQNDTDICLTCTESASATINCDISTYGNGTFIAAFYATGSFSLIDLLSIEEGQSFAEQIFGLLDKDDAAFYAIAMALIVVTMFLITPVLGIIGMIIGLVLIASLGFATISYAAFMGIIILGFVIIWSLKK